MNTRFRTDYYMAINQLYFFFVTGGLLVCGTFNSLIAKLIYGFTSTGWRGTVHHFKKPWFQTTNMFVGMVLCLPIKYLTSRLCAKAKVDEEQPLLEESPEDEDSATVPGPSMVIIPAVADLLATGLMMSGLVFTTASVYQMMRGAQVVFCCILSVASGKARLDQFQKMGIVITVLGISIVGAASCLADTSTEEVPLPLITQLFGIFLILLAQLVQAVQMITEQWLLQDIRMDALEVAGYEGLWGSILCFTVFLPLAYLLPGGDQGRLEDSYDSMLMLYHSGRIVLCEFLNCMSVLSYNWFGLVVTQDFTAMHRVIIEASRLCYPAVHCTAVHALHRPALPCPALPCPALPCSTLPCRSALLPCPQSISEAPFPEKKKPQNTPYPISGNWEYCPFSMVGKLVSGSTVRGVYPPPERYLFKYSGWKISCSDAMPHFWLSPPLDRPNPQPEPSTFRSIFCVPHPQHCVGGVPCLPAKKIATR